MSGGWGAQWLLALKFVHIAAVCVWVAGLVALLLVLARHRPHDDQSRYTRLRLLTQSGYVRLTSPAAVIAIGAGIPLIFLRGPYAPWLYAKLALVGLLCVIHALVGNAIIKLAEARGDVQLRRPRWLLAMLLPVTLGILVLVLLKPPLDVDQLDALDGLMQPQGRDLPVPRKVPI